MHVRIARESELAAVGELAVASYDADGYLVLPDGSYDEAYAAWLADAASRGHGDVLLVAVDGDELLGTVTWCPHGSPSAQLATRPHQGEFRALAVRSDVRRRGVARALLGDCLARARASGLTEVLLRSSAQLRPAHALYATLGFRRRPDLDWSPGPGIDLWAFSVTL